MKKIITLFLTIAFLAIGIIQPVYANESQQGIEYFDDGSYIVTVIGNEVQRVTKTVTLTCSSTGQFS